MLFWPLKPVAKPLAEVIDIKVDTATDRASGVVVCHAMLVMQTGDAWALAENEKKRRKTPLRQSADFSV